MERWVAIETAVKKRAKAVGAMTVLTWTAIYRCAQLYYVARDGPEEKKVI